MAFVSLHIFNQDPEDSDNDGGHRGNHNLGIHKLISTPVKFIQTNFPLANLLTLELFKLGSWYLLTRTGHYFELKDRRIKG